MKTKLLSVIALALLLVGCATGRLEQGGAYAPAGQVPDLQFYQIDLAYDLAYTTIDAAFAFEKKNRAALWKVSPKIKQTLDSIRPQADKANREYLKARAVYKSNPVPSGLTDLQTALGKLQQVSATASEVIQGQP